jgi:peptide/nickel transport system permease protein
VIGWLLPDGARNRARLRELRAIATNVPIVGGFAILVLFALLALAHPVLMATVWDGQRSVYDPLTGFDMTIAHPADPSLDHPLGTDTLGRDVLSMLTFASGSTLTIALTTAVVTGVIALAVGAVSAYWRGPVDAVLSHVSDATLLLPAPIAMIAVGLARPGLLSPFWFGVAYGVLAGLGAAAVVVRSYGLTVMEKPFIDAARIAGGGPWHIISRHLVPHLASLAAIQTMLAVTAAVIVAGFVEFMSPGSTDRVGFGSLIYSGIEYQELIFTRGTGWWALLSGALSISLLCGAFYLMSVGLRERLDPTRGEQWVPTGSPGGGRR